MSIKILIVDDSDDTREMMSKLLALEKFVVVAAADGCEGLRLVEEQQPDLIITDVNMPNMNGIDMIRQIRTLQGYERTPVMALTAYGNGVASEALQAGADRAATKPIHFAPLITAIKELLETRDKSSILPQ